MKIVSVLLVSLISSVAIAGKNTIDDTWTIKCVKAKGGYFSEHDELYSSGIWLLNGTLFEDAACTVPAKHEDIAYSVVIVQEGDHYNIDATIKSVHWGAASQKQAAKWNQEKFCGFTDWEVGVT